MIRTITTLMLVTFMVGCGARREAPTTSLMARDNEYTVTVLLDLSGSFAGMMADQGKAYEFTMQVLDRYFRDRIGMQDEIIIAQISGSNRSLLWQGTPLQLRQEFSSASAFRDFLKSKANPNGSRVHEAIVDTVNYVASDPRLRNKQVKSAVFVLSDMLDTSTDTAQTKERALKALAAYGQYGGTVALYYVDQHLVPDWRNDLGSTGIQHWCVESEIVGRPLLPSFE